MRYIIRFSICVTLYPNIINSKICSAKYNAFRKYQITRVGGAAIFSKREISRGLPSVVTDVETLLYKVVFESLSFIICAIPRPPNSSLMYLQN